MLRIVIADEQHVFSYGLRILIEKSGKGKVVGVVSFFSDAQKLLETANADILFLDLGLLGMDALGTIAKLQRKYMELKIILVVLYFETWMIHAMMRYKFCKVMCKLDNEKSWIEQLKRLDEPSTFPDNYEYRLFKGKDIGLLKHYRNFMYQ